MTTGRINQVAHNRIVLKRRAQLFCKSFFFFSKSTLAKNITAIRKHQLEPVTDLKISQLSNVWGQCSVQIPKGIPPHPDLKFAGTRNKIWKKVRYHLQSSELGPHKTIEKKIPPKKGRLLKISACFKRKKKNQWTHRSKNVHWGAN